MAYEVIHAIEHQCTRLSLNNAFEVLRSGGVLSGDVSFDNGDVIFTTDGKITYSKAFPAIKSVRIAGIDLDTTTEDIIQLTNGGGGGWISPTSKEDDDWTDSENIYDEDLGTFGWSSTNNRSVTLLVDAVSCSKVRIYAGRAAGGEPDLIVNVYYSGAFHEIHSGFLTEDAWEEIDIGSTQSVTKAKITTGDGIESQVFEFEFWNTSSSAHNITVNAGTISAIGFSSPTIYVKGVATSTIGTDRSEILVTTATAFNIDDLIIGYVNGYLEGRMSMIEFYNYELSSVEPLNLYEGKRFKELHSEDIVLDVSASSGTISDRWGNALTLANTTVYKDGDIQIVRLNGTTSHISIPHATKFNFGDTTIDGEPFAISAWVNIQDGNEFPIVAKGIYNTNAEYRILIDSSQKLHWQLFDESVADCYIGKKYDTALKLNKRYHVFCTYDGTEVAGGLKIYIDGVEMTVADSSNNGGSYVAMEPLAADIHIGRNDILYGKGLINDVKIIKGALTAEECSQVYTSTKHLYNG